MARDIEEFLRKAAERRQQAARGTPPPAAAPSPTPPSGPQPPIRRPAPAKQRPVPASIPVAEQVRPRESVAEHVRKSVNVNDVADRPKRLGQEVALADDKLESRLHEKFDHTVSRLTSTISDESEQKAKRKSSKSARPATIFEMLQSPQTIAQAVLLSEILKRPKFD